MMKRRDHTPITGKKIKPATTNEKGEALKRVGQTVERVSLIKKKNNINNDLNSNENKQNQRPQFYEFNNNSSSSNKQVSKIFKNNVTKTNFNMNDSRSNAEAINQTHTVNPVSNASMIISQVKQMGNKSVLIVKPNQFGHSINDGNNLSQSRSSKRKISDNQNKQNRFSLNKDTSLMKENCSNEISQLRNSKVSNFFRVDNTNAKTLLENERSTKRIDSNLPSTANRVSQSLQSNKGTSSLSKKGFSSSSVMTKMRSSSTRVSRKEEIPSSNTSISKNYSYTGKGKWKM